MENINHVYPNQIFFVYLFVLVILPLMAASFLILAISSDIIGSKSREAVFQSFKQTEFRLNQIVSNTEYLSDKLLGNEDVQQLSNLNEQSYPYEFVVRTNGLNYFLQQEIRVQPYLHSFLLINIRSRFTGSVTMRTRLTRSCSNKRSSEKEFRYGPAPISCIPIKIRMKMNMSSLCLEPLMILIHLL
ncbi:hypothetical protein [Paenibacillus periandrae]|uniref:hypothetical protein n=1 Tax=Paenibacillus periandrae TaxID=1761741 RepID=UPI001F08F6FF|nr:hypothetical protein [Paenibacillus periandrae]